MESSWQEKKINGIFTGQFPNTLLIQTEDNHPVFIIKNGCKAWNLKESLNCRTNPVFSGVTYSSPEENLMRKAMGGYHFQ